MRRSLLKLSGNKKGIDACPCGNIVPDGRHVLAQRKSPSRRSLQSCSYLSLAGRHSHRNGVGFPTRFSSSAFQPSSTRRSASISRPFEITSTSTSRKLMDIPYLSCAEPLSLVLPVQLCRFPDWSRLHHSSHSHCLHFPARCLQISQVERGRLSKPLPISISHYP